MKQFIFRSLLLIMLLIFPILPVRAAAPRPAPAPVAPVAGAIPSGLIKSDGSLNLDGSFYGTLSLEGWNVSLDGTLGPRLTPQQTNAGQANTSAGAWSALGGGISPVNNYVRAITISGSKVYIGGSFRNVDNIPEADYIAMWDGENWSALGNNGQGEGALWSEVYAIAVDGDKVYAGGSFQQVNNYGVEDRTAMGIARWDGQNWHGLGSNGAGLGSLNNRSVLAIAIHEGSVYIGGDFTDVNNDGAVLGAADYVARWDGQKWNALGGTSGGDGALNSVVRTLVFDASGNLYAGGDFTDVKSGAMTNRAADYIAKWNGSSWSNLGSGKTLLGETVGSLSGPVLAMAVDTGGNLFVGGSFENVRWGSQTLTAADFIARWDTNLESWNALGSDGSNGGSLNSHVKSVAAFGNKVYVGGMFGFVKDQGQVIDEAGDFAVFDMTTSHWGPVGESGNGTVTVNSQVWTIAMRGNELFVGGAFIGITNQKTVLSNQYLAVFDGTNWVTPPSSSLQGSLNGTVRCIAVMGSKVYVGGNFTDVFQRSIRLTAADYIAVWDGNQWAALGSNGADNGALNGVVSTLTVHGNDLYVGGEFTDVNNNGVVLPEADYIAKWNGAEWSALGDNSSGNGSINGRVNASVFMGEDLYIGGRFSNVQNDGQIWGSADYIARWDGQDWYPLVGNGSGNGSLTSEVMALATNGSQLYVGGDFKDVNNKGTLLPEADYIALWDGENWSALSSNGSGNGSINAYVSQIALQNDRVYVAGGFYNVNNNGTVLPAADRIVMWDGQNWSALGSDITGNGVFSWYSISSLLVDGSDVYVGGYFWDINDRERILKSADCIARWNGSEWSAISDNGAGNGSVQAEVMAMARSGSQLYVGGSFSDVVYNGQALYAADAIAAYNLSSSNQVYLPIAIR